LYRALLDNPISKKSEHAWLWITLLLKANHEKSEFIWNDEKIELKAGQFITGRKQLSSETGISESKVYRILKYLESEQQIEQQTNNKYTTITILNWEKYQGNEQQIKQLVNNKRTTTEQPANTNKNDKNKKNEKNTLAPSKLEAKITFNFDIRKWENIKKKDMEFWKDTYPACNIDIELKKMSGWLIGNPKRKKSNYMKFINGWLTTAQDKGGNISSNKPKSGGIYENISETNN